MNIPFFSICIETKNRSSTIERSLISVLNQDCRDFELILVDNSSTDNTIEIANKFFNSVSFQKKPFKYLIKNSSVNDLENWNKPIEFASGKYIAYLEGDDSFLEDHLSYAKMILQENTKIGLYFAKSLGKENFNLDGIIQLNSCDFLNEILLRAPAPSSMIFKRVIDDKIMYFNVKDYKYAPEVDFYLKIYSFGFQVYYSNKTSIKRDREKIPKAPKTNLKFDDTNTIINRWGKYFNCSNINNLRNRNYNLFFGILINEFANREKNWKKIWKKLAIHLKRFNYFTYIKYLIYKFALQLLINLGLYNVIKILNKKLKR